MVVVADQHRVDRLEVGERDRRAGELARDRAPAEEVALAGRVERRVGEQPPGADLDERGRAADVGDFHTVADVIERRARGPVAVGSCSGWHGGGCGLPFAQVRSAVASCARSLLSLLLLLLLAPGAQAASLVHLDANANVWVTSADGALQRQAHDRWQPGRAVRPADRGRRRRDPHLRPPRRLLRAPAATGRDGCARALRAAGVRLLGGARTARPITPDGVAHRRRLDGRPAGRPELRRRDTAARRLTTTSRPLRRRTDRARQRARRAAPELPRARVAALDHAPGPAPGRDPPGRDRRAGPRRRRCADGALARRPPASADLDSFDVSRAGDLLLARDVGGRPARRGRGPSPRAAARHRRRHPSRACRARLLRRAPRLGRSTARRAALVARRDDDRVDRRRRHPRLTGTRRRRARGLRPRAATRRARRHGRRVDRRRTSRRRPRAPAEEIPGRTSAPPSTIKKVTGPPRVTPAVRIVVNVTLRSARTIRIRVERLPAAGRKGRARLVGTVRFPGRAGRNPTRHPQGRRDGRSPTAATASRSRPTATSRGRSSSR